VFDGTATITNNFVAAPTENDAAYFTFTYQGFVEAQAPQVTVSNSDETNPTYKAYNSLASSNATVNANAAGYNLTTTGNGLTVANYYFVPQPGKFVITEERPQGNS
jgi:hypothetical protein